MTEEIKIRQIQQMCESRIYQDVQFNGKSEEEAAFMRGSNATARAILAAIHEPKGTG